MHMQLTRKTFLCTDTQVEKIDILKYHIGLQTDKAVFDMALESFYKSVFKYGTDPLVGGSATGNDIESQANRKILMKQAEGKAKQDLKEAPKKKICVNKLGGTVDINPDGSKLCRWKTYSTMSTPEDQAIPIMQVGEYLLANLFMPTREAVFKAQPELKEIFGDEE